MEYVTYRIVDPRDNVPVYIGQTSDFEYRKILHIRRAKKGLPRTKTFGIKLYLALLYSEGFEPEFEVLDVKTTMEESLVSENTWVEKTVNSGYPVLNRWKKHRKIVKNKFSSYEFKLYFCNRFPSYKIIDYAPKK